MTAAMNVAGRWGALRQTIRATMPGRFLLAEWFDLLCAAALFTLVVLAFMKFFGFSSRVRAARRAMLGRLYEMMLYRRSLRAVLRAEIGLVRDNAAMLFWLLPTLLFGVIVMALVEPALADRYRTAPLRPGEVTLVRCCALEPRDEWRMSDGDLVVPPTLTVEGVARSSPRQVVWTRMRCGDDGGSGIHSVGTGRGGEATFTINVARPDRPTRPIQRVAGAEVEIQYRPRPWFGMRDGWLVAFFSASIAVAIPIGRALRLRI